LLPRATVAPAQFQLEKFTVHADSTPMRALLACLMLLLALPAQAERLALVIGNADFEQSTDLPQTATDATSIAAKLRSLGFRLVGGKAHIDLTRAEMLQQIRALGSEAHEGDEVVFYFSGHGIGGIQTNYLLPVDDGFIETKEDVPELAVDVAAILDRLPKGGDGVNIFILDACRNNPLPTRAKSAYTEKGLVSVSRGATNTVFLYAAEPGERAYVSDTGRSYFTDALLGALDTPGEDLTDLMRRIRLRVTADTQDKSRQQLPWMEGLTNHPFYFRPGPKPSPAPLLASDEGTALAQALSANTLAAYTAFRAQFPDSANLAFVNAKISELSPRPPTPAGHKTGGEWRDTFTSGSGEGPVMVSVPAGEFVMGSPSGEEGRDHDEGPQRTVKIGYPIAVGKYDVTWSEYNACVSDGACPVAKDDGFGGGSRPVTNVSWEDARQYTTWLSGKTGKAYRLLSEAEWEYAVRAGTSTPFSTGATISPRQANYNGNYTYGRGERGTYLGKTAPVGSYDANAFGLYDMHGNVWQWVEDCYEAGYSTQPSDGSALTKSSCSYRVFRGGSWFYEPKVLRSANRDRDAPDYRSRLLGFRVARTLSD